MTKKQKEISLLLPLIIGKEVKVWINQQSGSEPCLEGTVEKFTGLYLILKHAILWNGQWFDEKMIHSGTIKKIELKQCNTR